MYGLFVSEKLFVRLIDEKYIVKIVNIGGWIGM